jgi:hypothetical protein
MATPQDLIDAVSAAEAAVAAEDTVETSAIALITQLNQLYHDALTAGGTSQEIVDRLTTLNAHIATRTQVLSESVLVNTPAAPPVP